MKRTSSSLGLNSLNEEIEPGKKTKSEDTAPKLEELCDDLLYEICKLLKPIDLLHLRTLNGRLREYVLEKRLWYQIDLSCTPLPPDILLYVLRCVSSKTTSILLWGSRRLPLVDYAYKRFTNQLFISLTQAEKSLTTLELCNITLNMDKITFYDFPSSLKVLALKGCTLKKCNRIKPLFNKIDWKLKNLEDLAIEDSDWLEPQYLMALSKLPCLKRLSLKGCSELHHFVPYGGPAARYGFQQLKTLDLRWCPLDSSDLQCFSALLNLQELLLERPKVDPEYESVELTNFARVVHLYKLNECTEKSLDDIPSTSKAAIARSQSAQGHTDVEYRVIKESNFNRNVPSSGPYYTSQIYGPVRIIKLTLPHIARNDAVNPGTSNILSTTSYALPSKCSNNLFDPERPVRYSLEAHSDSNNPESSTSNGHVNDNSNSLPSAIIINANSASTSSPNIRRCERTSMESLSSILQRNGANPSDTTQQQGDGYPRYTTEMIGNTRLYRLTVKPPENSDTGAASSSNNAPTTNSARLNTSHTQQPTSDQAQECTISRYNDVLKYMPIGRKGPFTTFSSHGGGYRPSDLYNIVDHALYSFGRAAIPPERHIVFIRNMDRRRDNNLQSLIIRNYRGITDFALQHLMQTSPNLRYIDISGTNVTMRGINLLRTNLPDCIIIADHLCPEEEIGNGIENEFSESDDHDSDEEYWVNFLNEDEAPFSDEDDSSVYDSESDVDDEN